LYSVKAEFIFIAHDNTRLDNITHILICN